MAESLLGKAVGGAASSDRGIVLVTAAAAADIKTARRGSNMPLPRPSAVMPARDDVIDVKEVIRERVGPTIAE